MPTGLPYFCLDYASKDWEPLAGISSSLRCRFAELARTTLKDLLGRIYALPDTYITHENQGECSPTPAPLELLWGLKTLINLFRAYHEAEVGEQRRAISPLLEVADAGSSFGGASWRGALAEVSDHGL